MDFKKQLDPAVMGHRGASQEKEHMNARRRVTSGVDQLDRILGGLHIGDNVIWYDDSGSLASVFCQQFMQTSQAQNKSIIYVSFDRSPRNLLDKLGPLSAYPSITILDCFTSGKGADAPTFQRFYQENQGGNLPCRMVRVAEPRKMDHFMDVLYSVHRELEGDVRFVFESLTGMQEIWGGEDHILNFYSHSCPRLYELNTIAYWIMEKKAHSQRLRAQISQIAQVVIDLSIKRGTTSLTILKAEKREPDNLHQPFVYWAKDQAITFEDEKRAKGGIDMGQRLRELRLKRSFSQTELARLVGVTPSTISQVESNLIFPSVPALLKMAEVLHVEVSAFFKDRLDSRHVVFRAHEAMEVRLPQFSEEDIQVRSLSSADFHRQGEPYLIEIPPNHTLSSHFFFHKGHEIGYLLSGTLEMKLGAETYTVQAGDVVYLTNETPSQWRNPADGPAKLLWIELTG
jgi:transcriptional regulator with XRE-family HTH domain/archaellum biogenesis ATPase FlaH